MKCELCHANNAETVLYRTDKKGHREELYVGLACAARARAFGQAGGVLVGAMAADMPPGATPTPTAEETPSPKELIGQLGELFGAISERLSGQEGEDGPARCPGCGTTIDELRAHGMAGCPKCFKTFRRVFRALLEDAQGCHVYGGDPLPGQERANELNALRKRLAEAVAREDYLTAKRLRAEIRRLTQGEGEADGK